MYSLIKYFPDNYHVYFNKTMLEWQIIFYRNCLNKNEFFNESLLEDYGQRCLEIKAVLKPFINNGASRLAWRSQQSLVSLPPPDPDWERR